MKLISYLTFNGNCREAMTFYKACLGGKLSFKSIGESPLCNTLPPHMKGAILHATLASNNLTLMATDMVGNEGLTKGNGVSLLLHCNSRKQVDQLFTALGRNGLTTQPIQQTYYGAWFGSLTDQYENHWLLHYGGDGLKGSK